MFCLSLSFLELATTLLHVLSRVHCIYIKVSQYDISPVQCSFFINNSFLSLLSPRLHLSFFFSEKMSTDAEIQNGAAEVAANVRACMMNTVFNLSVSSPCLSITFLFHYFHDVLTESSNSIIMI